MAVQKRFIQIVSVYPLPIPTEEKEDYFLLPGTVMRKKGFDCEYVTIRNQGSRTIESKFANDKAGLEYFKGFRIRRFDNTLKLLNYAREDPEAVLMAHMRPFAPSSFAGFLGNTKVMRTFTYVMGSSLPVAVFTAIILRRFNRIFAVTPYECGVYRKWKIPEKKITLLPLSINYEMFSKRVAYGGLKEKHGIREKDKVVIAVANVRKHKRYDVLLKAIPLVRKEIPGVKFVIVGDDWLQKAQNLPTVKQMALDLGVSDSVVLTGYQPPETVRKLYSLSDVFVHTAENEFQGLVSYEAAAMGIPLCLSGIGSHTSVFKEHALYHDVEDYKMLASNIVASIRHRDRDGRGESIRFLKQHMKAWDYPIIRERMSEEFDKILSE